MALLGRVSEVGADLRLMVATTLVELFSTPTSVSQTINVRWTVEKQRTVVVPIRY
jgi:hypothetical protein